MVSYAVQIRQMRPASVTIRKWREFLKSMFQAIGEEWVKEYLPRHFTADAAARYGYQPRSLKYQARKFKRLAQGKGSAIARSLGPIALVYSGRMYRQVTTGATVTPFPSRATIKLPGPYYISGSSGQGINVNSKGYVNRLTGQTVKANTRPNMGKEILTDTDGEKLAIAVEIDRRITEFLNANTTTIVEDA